MPLSVRPPAVAGFFYEADAKALRRSVESQMGKPTRRRARGSWRALLLPHAGHMYSGRIAGSAVALLEWPSTVLLLGPNHRGVGAAVAVSPSLSWRTPLGDVRLHAGLTTRLLENPAFEKDLVAHEREHSIEVLLPFLQVARPDVSVACVSIGEPDLDLCLSVGSTVASAVKGLEEAGESVAVVVSSDLNHYLPRAANRARDNRAIDAILAGDPVELFQRIMREDITMCGVLPATALLGALRSLEPVSAVLLSHGDSADAGGDDRRVVGYASILWERRGD